MSILWRATKLDMLLHHVVCLFSIQCTLENSDSLVSPISNGVGLSVIFWKILKKRLGFSQHLSNVDGPSRGSSSTVPILLPCQFPSSFHFLTSCQNSSQEGSQKARASISFQFSTVKHTQTLCYSQSSWIKKKFLKKELLMGKGEK